jgi:hypothetical protein
MPAASRGPNRPPNEAHKHKFSDASIAYTYMATDDDESPSAALLRLEPTAARLSTLRKVDIRNLNLSALPRALALCANSLEHLDIGGNPIRSLEGVDKLTKLRILFATGCQLGTEGALPRDGPLARVDSLFMLSLKENGLKVLDGASLPTNLGWLICAQNEISTVHSPSRLRGVRKLMLSHNRLDTAAAGLLISSIPELEMLRLACNQLEDVPEAAFAHPKLAWLAIGGNPYTSRQVARALDAPPSTPHGPSTVVATLPDSSQVDISEAELGRGSGAVVKRGTWQNTPVACKLWTAECFSDGDARGEWVMGKLTGGCPHVVRTLAAWERPALGMAVELLEGASAVGGPPNFDSVTRDTFTEGKHERLTARQAHQVALVVARAGAWLHERGLMHGDVYLHNTLRVAAAAAAAPTTGKRRRGSQAEGGDAAGDSDDVVRLSDLGAACAYDRTRHPQLEALEVRSYGWLVLDLLSWLAQDGDEGGARLIDTMRSVAEACSSSATPKFASAVKQLEGA